MRAAFIALLDLQNISQAPKNHKLSFQVATHGSNSTLTCRSPPANCSPWKLILTCLFFLVSSLGLMMASPNRILRSCQGGSPLSLAHPSETKSRSERSFLPVFFCEKWKIFRHFTMQISFSDFILLPLATTTHLCIQFLLGSQDKLSVYTTSPCLNPSSLIYAGIGHEAKIARASTTREEEQTQLPKSKQSACPAWFVVVGVLFDQTRTSETFSMVM